MKIYNYKAIDLKGNIVKGKYVAESKKQLINKLYENGFFIIDYKIKKFNFKRMFVNKVSLKDISIFCNQFSKILKCGINISSGLKIICEQDINILLKEAIYSVQKQLEEGNSIYSTMKKFPNVFPNFMVQMLYVGEKSGRLEKVLDDLSTFYLKQYNLYKKVGSIFIYPVIVFTLTISMMLLVILKIIPSIIENIFISSDFPIPYNIQKLLQFGSFVSSKKCILIILCLCILILYSIKKSYHKKVLSFINMKIPFIKDIYKSMNGIRFIKSLNLLISSGIPIVLSLEIIKNSTGDIWVEDKIKDVILYINEGTSLWKALDNSSLVNKFYIPMIAIGEETGSLEEMLKSISDIYESEVNENVNKLSKIIEPATIILLAIFVTFIIINIIMPIIDIIDVIGNTSI